MSWASWGPTRCPAGLQVIRINRRCQGTGVAKNSAIPVLLESVLIFEYHGSLFQEEVRTRAGVCSVQRHGNWGHKGTSWSLYDVTPRKGTAGAVGSRALREDVCPSPRRCPGTTQGIPRAELSVSPAGAEEMERCCAGKTSHLLDERTQILLESGFN